MNYKFVNENGRTYAGNAGLLHEIKLEGGYDSFMKNRMGAAIASFLESPQNQDIIEAMAQKNANARRIKMERCG